MNVDVDIYPHAERRFRRLLSFIFSEPHEGKMKEKIVGDTTRTQILIFVTFAVNHAVHRMNVKYVYF